MFVSNRICQLWLAAILVANCLAQFSSVKTKNLSIRNQKSDEGIPFADEMFRIVRSGPSNVGDNVDFSFQLPSGQSLQNPNCTFITPSGKNISSTPQQNNETDVFDDAGVVIKNFTAHPSGPHNDLCGLSINGIVPEDFGEWHCIINDGEAFHHIGALTILTKAEIFVKDVRLPRHIQPVNYGVDLFPVIEVGNFTTNGILRFKFQRVADDEWLQKDPNLYKKVFLTAKDIAIDEYTVLVKKADDSQTFSIVAHEYDFERDFYIIHLNEKLPTGTDLLVEMKFKSYLNDYLSGFYRSRYFDEEAGEFKHLAVTQFESHFARWAFPCLDEPDRKATFTISLKHKANMTALSNMDEDRVVNDEDGYKITYFKESVKMSTYLVAFLVSDFSFTELTPNYKIWHQAAKKGQAQISAENGPKILKFYEDFFNITYPLPKTDMAAIPDFSFGAMENWGLITYRETLLLFVYGISDAGNKESILTVMAHELAHQWFGNLVTMKWWTDLWLNEGFATYTEYHGVDHVFKEARVRDRMVLQEVQFVFGVDALESTTALSQPVFNPTYDILIGSIAYSKGGSILRMVENFLTLETFKKGVTQYLTKNAYQNAERDDLWSALTEAAQADNRLPEGLTIKDIMDSWTSEPGFPVVKVEKNDGKSITLSQKRFYLNAEVAQPSTVKWTIPINVAYPEAKDSGFATTTPQEWMLESEMTLNITESPFVINIQETGYYRVNYDDKNWQALTNVLKKNHSLIHELNRAQILDDGLQLARAKQLDYETALGLTEYLEKETEYIPWESAINGLRYLDLLLNDNSSLTEYGYFKAYLTKLLTPVYTKLGFGGSDSDLHLTILQRQSVLTTLCRMGHPDCVSKSVKLFKQWVDKPTVNPISANLREVVYETAIRNGGEAEWEFLWKQFLKEQVDSEKQKIMYGLGATTDENSIHKYLTETLGKNIRLQDVIYVYRAIGSFAPGRRFQFEWLQENWDEIKEYMKSKFSDFMVNLVSGYGAAANTESEIKILEDFLENRRPDLGLSTGDIESIIETARINLKWMNENKQTVSDWLKSRVPVPTTTPTPVTTTTSSASRLSYALTIVFGMLLCVKHQL